ncbi:hypothetical protein SAMN04487764_1541 [Gillisia sp. Hel1_33_143]|uniref:hypothetical protein n=1 Tax=Gillisia sp. Hel1_33_143 TaxID=1336796 RepID=UPI00087AA6C7|nr:hypothetical protein [Gillisia sp. Hel1_33_143]SDS13969.1 hypothetical protein SAMN04487764_1541 [Gillisia sp. Hel1_33_143]
MKELHAYLTLLGFDVCPLTAKSNRFFGNIITDTDKEVKTLFIKSRDPDYKDLLVMDIFDIEDNHERSAISRQKVSTSKELRTHMLNSYNLKRLCPELYQKIVETPV